MARWRPREPAEPVPKPGPTAEERRQQNEDQCLASERLIADLAEPDLAKMSNLYDALQYGPPGGTAIGRDWHLLDRWQQDVVMKCLTELWRQKG